MELIQVAAGRPYSLAVRSAIDAAKAGDPLRPVRVLVSSNISGLSLRRMLGSVALNSPSSTPTLGPAGIANVNFSTPFQFASLLAAPALASSGQRPLTTAVLAAAVRHVLSTDPGRFGAVAEHVATEAALIRAYGEITEMPPARRRALASSTTERTRDLLRFVDAVGEHLASGSATSYHDEYTVLAAATAAAESTEESFVFAGPFTQGVAVTEFLSSVASGAAGRAVWALTGDMEVDAEARQQAEQIVGGSVPAVECEVAQPTSLLPVADPDEEVRVVVRSILAAADRGVRFDRMAIFVPVRAPYLRSVREQLDAAGVPSAGPDHRTLADSMTGRLLHRLLAVADASLSVSHDKQFEREAVLALVEAAPMRGADGRLIRSGPWENISRSAGVVSGLDDWTYRLGAHIESLTKRIDDNQVDSAAGFLDGWQRERVATQALRDFVEWLAELTSPTKVGRSWSERSAWARSALASLLPQHNRRSSWPETELDAAERVDQILSRVGVLDDVEPNLTSAAFLRAIQLELDVPAGRRGRFGTGVLVAPLASAVGLDLDEVYVLGLAEGVCPRPIREDTLLPDAERSLTGGGLSMRADRNREERQRFLHAVASGSERVTLVSPQGDHRSGRTRTASRWWVDAVRSRTNDATINSRTWHNSPMFSNIALGSFDESLTSALVSGVITSGADLQLQQVHGRTRFAVEIADEHMAPSLRRGLEQIDERLVDFNRFTGDLSDIEIRSPLADDKAISPTRLERWASCPRQFYFEQMLRLGEIERPEEITEISALDKGNLWHQILEDFIRESLPGQPFEITHAEQGWTDADRTRLRSHAERRYKQYEDLGRTGRPILWAIKKEESNADLEAFLASDEALRTKLRMTPRHVELPFGLGSRVDSSANAAEVTLDDGRRITLRGLIDRVDMRDDGTPVVLDYKTGRAQSQSAFDKDPVVGGKKLQLGVYAEAARQHFGTETAHAYYWYTSTRGEFKEVGYPWTSERSDRFTDSVTTIVDGIERGDFPPNPGDYSTFRSTFENCTWCAFSRICPVDRDEEFERAVTSGRLVDFVAMQSPPEPDDEQDSGDKKDRDDKKDSGRGEA